LQHEEVVKKLIEDPKFDVNYKNCSLLCEAIYSDNINIVKLILEHPTFDIGKSDFFVLCCLFEIPGLNEDIFNLVQEVMKNHCKKVILVL
jgi:hypothetical protein